MSLSPVFVRPSDAFGTVITLIASTGLHRVTVVDDDERPIGVVSLSDILEVVASRLYLLSPTREDGDDAP
jgi:CBS domain-containing protein